MKTIKGPAVYLAQFMDTKAPFNSLDGLCQWAADLGYKGIQILKEVRQKENHRYGHQKCLLFDTTDFKVRENYFDE